MYICNGCCDCLEQLLQYFFVKWIKRCVVISFTLSTQNFIPRFLAFIYALYPKPPNIILTHHQLVHTRSSLLLLPRSPTCSSLLLLPHYAFNHSRSHKTVCWSFWWLNKSDFFTNINLYCNSTCYLYCIALANFQSLWGTWHGVLF